MVRLDRIYTRGGDGGETSLGDGQRVRKDALRVAAYGEVDELNAQLGVCRVVADGAPVDGWLERIQNDLFDLGADLCVPEAPREDVPQRERSRLRVEASQVAWLERRCDETNGSLDPLTSFVLPGGNALGAHLHVARAVCRRAERSVVSLAGAEHVNDHVVSYLNRLSDLLFLLARAANGAGHEVLWVPGASRAGDEDM